MNTAYKDKNLGSLSNSALIDRLREVSKKEIGTTVELLKHLNEIDKRELFLDLGYSSLFSYLVSGLNYCKGSAYRRIACARLAEVYPSAYQYLCSREVSLTTAALISGQCMKESTEKGRDLLESIRGKSKTEVEQLLAKHRPVPKVRESLKPVAVHEKVKPESKTGSLFSLEKLTTKKSGSVSKKTYSKTLISFSRRGSCNSRGQRSLPLVVLYRPREQEKTTESSELDVEQRSKESRGGIFSLTRNLPRQALPRTSLSPQREEKGTKEDQHPQPLPPQYPKPPHPGSSKRRGI